MPRTQSPKIDGLKELEGLGRPVTLELIVYPGEDVVTKLLKVWKASNYSSYVVSAFGHISKAAIGKPSSDMFHIYDGHFEILSLSGSCCVNQEDGYADWSLGITLADSDSDREAFGGTFINTLIASGTVSVGILNFVKEEEKSTEKNCDETGMFFEKKKQGKRIKRSSSSAKDKKIDGLKEVKVSGSRPILFELTVYPGQDVVAKLWKLWEASNRSSYIISPSGHISKAAIGKPRTF
ncbi:AT-hook motif nuclear-localized protein 4-like [Arachis stenosperma]|uniref:AT-hook motif nuclear-localized protein 4-like n=1 Tax=Arachis stenosperma TaxID=217475 RepID=UPI0025AC1D27|nr:AT-hook motif nuclear-localized protein 4-like [Arachis stenosperma]